MEEDNAEYYRSANPWKNFATIELFDAEEVDLFHSEIHLDSDNISVDGVSYLLTGGYASVWGYDKSVITPNSDVVIPDVVAGCLVTSMNKYLPCKSLTLPPTMDYIDFSFDDDLGDGGYVDYVITNNINPSDRYSILKAFFPGYEEQDLTGTETYWVKVPKGYETNYATWEEYNEKTVAYVVQNYSEEVEIDGVVYRVNRDHKGYTGVVYDYTPLFSAGANSTFEVPLEVYDQDGRAIRVVGIDAIPDVETVKLPISGGQIKFLRNRTNRSLKTLVIPESDIFVNAINADQMVIMEYLNYSGNYSNANCRVGKVYFYGSAGDFIKSPKVTYYLYGDQDHDREAIPDNWGLCDILTSDTIYVPSSELDNFISTWNDLGLSYSHPYTFLPMPEDKSDIYSWVNGLKYQWVDTGGVYHYTVNGYYGTLPEDLLIPYSYGGLPVDYIDFDAFAGTNIKSVSGGRNLRGIGSNAFKNCTNLQSVTLGSSDEMFLGESTFENCSSLKTVTLGAGIFEMGSSAFQGTSRLSEFNSTIRGEIPSNAFYGSGIKTLRVNERGLTAIGESAFASSQLTALVGNIDTEETESLTIGSNAFNNCTGLTNVELRGAPVAIGNTAFSGCTSLCSVTFDHTPLSIGNMAFYRCGNLKTAMLNQKSSKATYTTTLGREIFGWCTNLKTLALPAKVSLSDNVLGPGVYNLEMLHMPESWSTLPDGPFSGTPANTVIVSYAKTPSALNNLSFSVDTYEGATLRVPQGTLATYKAAAGWKNFANLAEMGTDDNKVYVNDVEYTLNLANNTAQVTGYHEELLMQQISYIDHDWGIEQVTTPIYNTHDEVTLETTISWCGADYKVSSIATEAFKDCHILRKVVIPEAIIALGNNTFTGSTVEEVVIQAPALPAHQWTIDSETGIGTNPFWGCEKLVKVSFTNPGLTYIQPYFLAGATALKEVVLPEKLEVIGNYAFYESGIESIELPTTVYEIRTMAFRKTQLKSLTLHEGVKTLGTGSIWETPLEYLYVPSTITSMTSLTGCSELKKLVYADNLPITTIASGNCKSLTKLEEVVLPAGVTQIYNQAFYGCTSLKSINLPEGLERIDWGAFDGCTSLADVSLPSTVTYIGQVAFRYCPLKQITVPAGVTYVGEYAFRILDEDGEYGKLPYVISYPAEPPTRGSSTNNVYKWVSSQPMPILYVPKGSKEAYEATVWGTEFTDIREFPGAEFTVYADDVATARGASVKVPVDLFNMGQAEGVKFDVTLPEGVSLATTADGQYAVTLGDRTSDHQLIVNRLRNGDYRFIVVSLTSQPITGTDGALLTLRLDVPTGESVVGEHAITYHNIQVVALKGDALSSMQPGAGTSAFTISGDLVGDVDNSGTVDLLDVIQLLRHVNGIETLNPLNMVVTDATGDGAVDLLDALRLLQVIATSEASSNSGTFDSEGELTAVPGADGVDISLSSVPCTALQFDVTLPAGVTAEGVTLDASRRGDHSAQLTDLGGGRYRVMVYSLSCADLRGTSGRLLHLSTTLTPTDVRVDGIQLATNALEKRTLLPVEGYTTGIGRLSGGLRVTSDADGLLVTADAATTLTIMGLDGRLVRRLEVPQGTSRHQGLAPGVYMVGGERFIIR